MEAALDSASANADTHDNTQHLSASSAQTTTSWRGIMESRSLCRRPRRNSLGKHAHEMRTMHRLWSEDAARNSAQASDAAPLAPKRKTRLSRQGSRTSCTAALQASFSPKREYLAAAQGRNDAKIARRRKPNACTQRSLSTHEPLSAQSTLGPPTQGENGPSSREITLLQLRAPKYAPKALLFKRAGLLSHTALGVHSALLRPHECIRHTLRLSYRTLLNSARVKERRPLR